MLAAAVSASRDLSYRVKLTDSSDSSTTEGAFDPATNTGYLRVTGPSGVTLEEWLIKGELYIRSLVNPVVTRAPGKGYELGWGGGTTETLTVGMPGVGAADPNKLLLAAEKSDLPVTRTSANSFRIENLKHYEGTGPDAGISKIVVEVTLGADKRVAKMVVTYTFHSDVSSSANAGPSSDPSAEASSAPGGNSIAIHSVTTMELSDYGKPVTVERPTVGAKAK
jgi:hypothetical protein